MDLSKKTIRSKHPCSSGFRWFLKHTPQGADYQYLIDTLLAEGRVTDALWLVDQFGPVRDKLVIDSLDSDAVVAARDLDIAGNLHSDTVLRVAGALHVRNSVRVGGDIHIEGDLFVEGNLSCGGAMIVEGSVRVGWVSRSPASFDAMVIPVPAGQ